MSVIPWHAIGSSVALIFPKNISQHIYLPPSGLSPCTIRYRIPIVKALTVQLQALWHYITALCTVGGVRGRRFKSYVLILKGYIKRNRGFSVIVELRITICWMVCLSVQMNAKEVLPKHAVSSYCDWRFNYFDVSYTVCRYHKDNTWLPTYDTLQVVQAIYILVRLVSVHFSVPSSGTEEDYWESQWFADQLLCALEVSFVVML